MNRKLFCSQEPGSRQAAGRHAGSQPKNNQELARAGRAGRSSGEQTDGGTSRQGSRRTGTQREYCHCPSWCSYKFSPKIGTRMGYTRWNQNWPRIGFAVQGEADARPVLGAHRVPHPGADFGTEIVGTQRGAMTVLSPGLAPRNVVHFHDHGLRPHVGARSASQLMTPRKTKRQKAP